MSAQAWIATPDEAETVGTLMIGFRNWMGRDWPSNNAVLAAVDRLIEQRDTEFLLASPDADSPPAGVCALRYRFGIWYASEDCWLEDLFVHDEGRRKGVADTLLTAAVDRARERGCRRMELDVNEHNEAALPLYERHGFAVSQKPPGGRDVLMRLVLDQPG